MPVPDQGQLGLLQSDRQRSHRERSHSCRCEYQVLSKHCSQNRLNLGCKEPGAGRIVQCLDVLFTNPPVVLQVHSLEDTMSATAESLERLLLQQYRPVSLAGPAHLQPESQQEIRKSLNIQKDYMRHLPVTLNEHVQNFLDQCKVASQGATRKVVWGSELGGGGRQGAGESFVAVVRSEADIQGRQAVGCCAQYLEHGCMVVKFRNYGCQLRMDHMQLGTSTKKEKADLAGNCFSSASPQFKLNFPQSLEATIIIRTFPNRHHRSQHLKKLC